RFLAKFGGQLMSGKVWRPNLKHHITLYVLLTAVGFMVSSISANAQTATGRVIGTVTDAHGRAIAGPKVTVTNSSTNVRSNTVTNADGFYQVLQLPVGTYTLTVEHDGFSKVVTEAESLDINQ